MPKRFSLLERNNAVAFASIYRSKVTPRLYWNSPFISHGLNSDTISHQDIPMSGWTLRVICQRLSKRFSSECLTPSLAVGIKVWPLTNTDHTVSSAGS